MDTGNRIIGTLAFTIVLTTLAVKLQSDPPVPSMADQGTMVSTSQPDPPAPIYPTSPVVGTPGAANPSAYYGAQLADDTGPKAGDSIGNEDEEDYASFEPEPPSSQPYSDPITDYSNVEPGVISDQEVMNQAMAAMDPEQQASFLAGWAMMNADERQSFIDDIRGN